MNYAMNIFEEYLSSDATNLARDKDKIKVH